MLLTTSKLCVHQLDVVNTENDVMSGQYNNIAKKFQMGRFPRFSPMRSRRPLLCSSVAFSSLQVNVSVQKKIFCHVFFFKNLIFSLLLSLNSFRNLITEKQNISLNSTLERSTGIVNILDVG